MENQEKRLLIEYKPKLSYYERNRIMIQKKQKAKYDANAETIKKRRRELYDKKHKKSKSAYYFDHLKERKEYYHKNKDKIIGQIGKLRLHKYHTNPQFRMKDIMRARINDCIWGKGNFRSIEKYVGLNSIHTFLRFLETKFKPGMSWDNRKEWHIDHIIPTTQFDLTTEDGLMKCYHYSNLQILWARENIRKSASIQNVPSVTLQSNESQDTKVNTNDII